MIQSPPPRAAATRIILVPKLQRLSIGCDAIGSDAYEEDANVINPYGGTQLLAQQTAAMRHLAEVVKRDLRDIAIMEKEKANQVL